MRTSRVLRDGGVTVMRVDGVVPAQPLGQRVERADVQHWHDRQSEVVGVTPLLLDVVGSQRSGTDDEHQTVARLDPPPDLLIKRRATVWERLAVEPDAQACVEQSPQQVIAKLRVVRPHVGQEGIERRHTEIIPGPGAANAHARPRPRAGGPAATFSGVAAGVRDTSIGAG